MDKSSHEKLKSACKNNPPSSGKLFLSGSVIVNDALAEVKNKIEREECKNVEKWNARVKAFQKMQNNYNIAIRTFKTKGAWTGALMKAVIPMLKRKGDGNTPTKNKDLIPYFNTMHHRPPLSFSEYINTYDIDIPSRADIANPQVLDEENSDGNPTATALTNNGWHKMDAEDMNTAEIMLELAGGVVSL